MIKYIRIILLILLSGAMISCATFSSPPTHTADNKPIHHIDCTGKTTTLDQCYQQAARICPHGYNVISTKAHSSYDRIPILPLLLPIKLIGKMSESAAGKKGISVSCN